MKNHESKNRNAESPQNDVPHVVPPSCGWNDAGNCASALNHIAQRTCHAALNAKSKTWHARLHDCRVTQVVGLVFLATGDACIASDNCAVVATPLRQATAATGKFIRVPAERQTAKYPSNPRDTARHTRCSTFKTINTRENS
jgi:hypothetical protein